MSTAKVTNNNMNNNNDFLFSLIVEDPIMRKYLGLKMLSDDNKNNDLMGLLLLENDKIMPVNEVNSKFINGRSGI